MTLYPGSGQADLQVMSLARNPLGVSLPVSLLLPPEDDVTSLLPGPNSVTAQLAERLAAAAEVPGALVLVGLLREDGTEAATPGSLARTTVVMARSVRGDDWLGRSGTAQYALLLSGGLQGAMTAAARVVGGISALDVPGLGVCAGVTFLEAGTPPREVLRRAADALAAATAAGAGAVCSTGTRRPVIRASGVARRPASRSRRPGAPGR
ncbi:hypothetical protein ACI782_17170 [Geodermatophilus sp. SYSU D00703]